MDNLKFLQKIHTENVDKNVDMWMKHTVLGGCTQNFYQQLRKKLMKIL